LKHLISTSDIGSSDYAALAKRTSFFQKRVASGIDFTNLCRTRVLGTAFCMESTRTYAALQSAAAHLGMRSIGFSGIEGKGLEHDGESLAEAITALCRESDIIATRQSSINLNDLRSLSNVPIINCGTVEHVLAAIGYISTLFETSDGLADLESVGFLGITPEFYDHVAVMRVLSDFGLRVLVDPCERVFGGQDSFFEDLRTAGVRFELSKYGSFKDKVDALFIIIGPGSSAEDINPFCRDDCIELREKCSVFYSMPIHVSEGSLSWTIASNDLDDDNRVQNGRFVDALAYSTMAAITYLLDVEEVDTKLH
jgi:hypothetical protein